ncbi:MAG: carbonic anhydrase [Rhodobacterales bacterium]|nr:MAG: carbonic anhydrase [Rhodobacterales bacterium]
MPIAQPLPASLAKRHLAWKAGRSSEAKARMSALAGAQNPAAMVISCCDSRVIPTNLFGLAEDDFFVQRSVANLVPPFGAGGPEQGTAAAVQFALTALKVPHLIVMGHSNCGGVHGYHRIATGKAPELADSTNFVGRWIRHLAPAYEKLRATCSGDACADALEKEGVKMSLDNLMSFDFVREAVEAGRLTLHGLWNDIGKGDLWWYDAEADAFRLIEAAR